MSYTGESANANGTGEATPAESASPSGTASESATAATPSSTGAAYRLEVGGILALAGAVVGAVGIM